VSSDRQFAISGKSDGVQWVLQRQRRVRGAVDWRPVSFVRSTRDILPRPRRSRPPRACSAPVRLLSRLRADFETWTAEKLTTPAPIGDAAGLPAEAAA
jgi:hypothetical protein